ncbi:MAG: sterol carrier family protein [Mycobacteriales bacterium]
MPKPARVDPVEGQAAVEEVTRTLGELGPVGVEPAVLATAVRYFVGLLRDRAPGHSVEVRIPGPAGTAFQCGEGPQHTRGTPPNVVETDPLTFFQLCTGRLGWEAAVASGSVRASGQRADLSTLLPVIGDCPAPPADSQ